MAEPAPSDAVEALPDLTLGECCKRWGVNSHNAIKDRAAALRVELRQESSTRTVWPAEHLALGDELAKHLKQPGATLSNFRRLTLQNTSKEPADIKDAFIGCLALIALFFFVGCTAFIFSNFSKKTVEEKKNTQTSTQTAKRQSEQVVPIRTEEKVQEDRSLTINEQVVPIRTEEKVREDRSLIVNGSRLLNSISVNNPFMDTVSSKGGKLIAVYMTIRNIGNESGNMFWTTLQLVDSKGRKYDKIEDFNELLTVNMWTKAQGLGEMGDQLFPGASAQTVAVFRVSPDATKLRLVANSSKYFSIE